MGENFHGFSLNCECLPVNHGFVDQQYKSTEMLQQKFYHEQLFSTQNAKVSPADVFSYMVQEVPCSQACTYAKLIHFNMQASKIVIVILLQSITLNNVTT